MFESEQNKVVALGISHIAIITRFKVTQLFSFILILSIIDIFALCSNTQFK